MARPREHFANDRPRKQQEKDDFASLSTEVLRLRLQAPSLPITGGKAALISRLNLATKQPRAILTQQAGCARTKRLAQKSQPVRATSNAPGESRHEQANLGDPVDHSSSLASGGDLDELMEDFSLDESPDPAPTGLFTDPLPLAAIHDTVRSSLDQALQSFPWTLGHDTQPNTFINTNRRLGSAAPVGLNRPLEPHLQDKILRGEYIDFSLLLPDSLARPSSLISNFG